MGIESRNDGRPGRVADSTRLTTFVTPREFEHGSPLNF